MRPWVEKYRPQRVTDVAHQDEVVRALQSAIETGSLPHLLFYGPPGTGKTSTILAAARVLFGPELYKDRILELNASDERGIKVVREKVKRFAQIAVGTQQTKGYPCPRFKIIILDEADTMTSEAQSALRRTMEQYSRITRFCLICNYVTRIIEPLASRCAKFRFKLLSTDSMMTRLRYIADQEGVQADDHVLTAVMEASDGDMRKAVTYLQSAHQLASRGTITPQLITDISGKVPQEVLDRFWAALTSSSFDVMQATVDDMILEGYPLGMLLSQLHDQVVTHSVYSDLQKAEICEQIADIEKRLIDGANESLQLLNLAGFMMRQLQMSSQTY